MALLPTVYRVPFTGTGAMFVAVRTTRYPPAAGLDAVKLPPIDAAPGVKTNDEGCAVGAVQG